MILSKTILNPWNTGYAEVQSHSFRPVEGSKLNLYELKTMIENLQYFQGYIDPLSQSCTSSALDQRYRQCATQTPVTECPYFQLWDFKFASMLLKRPIFEASLCTHAPAAASETCL